MPGHGKNPGKREKAHPEKKDVFIKPVSSKNCAFEIFLS